MHMHLFSIYILFQDVMQLSKRGVSDSDMMCGGLILSIVGYSSLYLMWTQDASVLQFYIPILLGASCFPFLAAPTRSIFTVAVNAKPALSKYHGLMQSILSMGASVAGFVTVSYYNTKICFIIIMLMIIIARDKSQCAPLVMMI
jgi:hypothetical protein